MLNQGEKEKGSIKTLNEEVTTIVYTITNKKGPNSESSTDNVTPAFYKTFRGLQDKEELNDNFVSMHSMD